MLSIILTRINIHPRLSLSKCTKCYQDRNSRIRTQSLTQLYTHLYTRTHKQNTIQSSLLLLLVNFWNVNIRKLATVCVVSFLLFILKREKCHLYSRRCCTHRIDNNDRIIHGFPRLSILMDIHGETHLYKWSIGQVF